MESKTEVILGATSFFVEVKHYTVIFRESRPVSFGQQGVDFIMLSRSPGLNGTGGVWTLTDASPDVSMCRISEAHLYCANRFGASFAPYPPDWTPGRVKDGVWTPIVQASCQDETPPSTPPAAPPVLCSPETDPGASGS